jgi:hypothetical protein
VVEKGARNLEALGMENSADDKIGERVENKERFAVDFGLTQFSHCFEESILAIMRTRVCVEKWEGRVSRVHHPRIPSR